MQTSASLQPHQQPPYGTAALASNAAIMQPHPQHSLQQQQHLVKQATATSMGEIWQQKNEYMIVAYDGTAGAGSSSVAYHHHPENPQGYIPSVPKIEVDSSPVSINMDVPQ